MRIEKHEGTCYISHNGLTVFVNKKAEGFDIKVTVRRQEDICDTAKITWNTVGLMDLNIEELRLFASYLAELVK